MARRRRRRPLLVLLALLVLAGVAVGVVYVLHAAKKRTNLFQQALTAHRSGHDEEAESDLKSLLAANPGHARGRALLIQLLLSRGKTDEAEALARYWLASSDTEAMGTQTLSEIAFRQLDFDKALGLARQVVDRDPAFAQAMTVQVETVRGSPADRARAARASETLASLVSTPEDAAAAWLFAAETWQEIERSIPQGEAPRVVTARASAQERTELAARKARDALHRSPVFSGSLELSTLYMNKIPAIKAIGARIDLVSGDPEGQAKAVAYLEDYLSTRPEAYADRAALARYYLAHDALPKATEQVRALAEGPTLIYVRALGELAAAGGRAAVLEMIESKGATQGKLLALLKARLLVGGTDPSERAAGEALLEKMAIEAPKDWPLVLDASRRIREAGDPDRATKLLQEVAAAVPDLRPAVSVERAVQAIRAGHADDAREPLEEVAKQAPGRDLLQAYQLLSRLGDAGHVAGLDLLREAGDTDREGRDQIRLLRAAVWSVEAGADPEGRLYHDLAAEDLRSLALAPASTRATLTNVAALATSSGNLEVAGTAVGRALVAEGDSGEPVDLFLRALGSTDPTDRERVARGLREAAAPEGPYAGWQGTLARALEQGDGRAAASARGEDPRSGLGTAADRGPAPVPARATGR